MGEDAFRRGFDPSSGNFSSGGPGFAYTFTSNDPRQTFAQFFGGSDPFATFFQNGGAGGDADSDDGLGGMHQFANIGGIPFGFGNMGGFGNTGGQRFTTTRPTNRPKNLKQDPPRSNASWRSRWRSY